MDELYRQFLGIAFVLAVLAGCLWFAKRRGFARFNLRTNAKLDLVQVVERIPLTAQHTLFVLSIAGRTVLLSSSPGSCQLITEIPGEALAARQAEPQA